MKIHLQDYMIDFIFSGIANKIITNKFGVIYKVLLIVVIIQISSISTLQL